jgi:hypothetical protein
MYSSPQRSEFFLLASFATAAAHPSALSLLETKPIKEVLKAHGFAKSD